MKNQRTEEDKGRERGGRKLIAEKEGGADYTQLSPFREQKR
jgi:hypothetical protein